jgi:hypothetical protein
MNCLYFKCPGTDAYAELEYLPSDTVGRLARRVCDLLQRTPPISLLLVKLSGRLPSLEEESSAVALMDPSRPLAEVGIVKGGEWLLAQLLAVDPGPSNALDASAALLREFYLLGDKVTANYEELLGKITMLPARSLTHW